MLAKFTEVFLIKLFVILRKACGMICKNKVFFFIACTSGTLVRSCLRVASESYSREKEVAVNL